MKLECFREISKKNIQISNVMKIRPVADTFLHAIIQADPQTDRRADRQAAGRKAEEQM